MSVDYSPSDPWISVCVGRASKWKKCHINVFEGNACSFAPPQLWVSSSASRDACHAAYLLYAYYGILFIKNLRALWNHNSLTSALTNDPCSYFSHSVQTLVMQKFF